MFPGLFACQDRDGARIGRKRRPAALTGPVTRSTVETPAEQGFPHFMPPKRPLGNVPWDSFLTPNCPTFSHGAPTG